MDSHTADNRNMRGTVLCMHTITGLRNHQGSKLKCKVRNTHTCSSLVPRPVPFSVTRTLSQGLGSKVTCARPRVERYSGVVIMSMGVHNSRAESEDSKLHFLQLVFTAHL